jgi:hypothetical protein
MNFFPVNMLIFNSNMAWPTLFKKAKPPCSYQECWEILRKPEQICWIGLQKPGTAALESE